MNATTNIARCPIHALAGLCLLAIASTSLSQELDPRAYARVPAGVNFVVAGFSYSHGGIVTDATSAMQNTTADVETASLSAGHAFSLFGQTAQAFAVLPYSWARGSAEIGGQTYTISRSGISDMRFRLSLLFLGAPAASGPEFAKIPRQTIMGASVLVTAPTGQYSSDQAANLGANRWAFKPELALSHPVGDRWLFDLYSAIWLFTANDSYYPGSSSRTQDPLLAFQAHISYTFRPQMWAAIDMTYYTGGLSFVNGSGMDDRQDNSRIGWTFVFPAWGQQSVRISGSTGAIIRYGANFTTVALGWQVSFF